MRAAVVGHVEWVTFGRVARLPQAGEIVHAGEPWEEAAGGGAVAAVELLRLGAERVDFFCAVGEDHLGETARERLEGFGLHVHAAVRPHAQRRAFTLTDDAAERTIVILGERLVPHGDDPLPWDELAQIDCVYFTGGDEGALHAARRARKLVATGRAREVLRTGHVELDALVASARDPAERLDASELDPAPRAAVHTMGSAGGAWEAAGGRRGEWQVAPPPGPPVDAYGCGDCFAAGLTYGLGLGQDLAEAVETGNRAGALALTRRGPYGGSGA